MTMQINPQKVFKLNIENENIEELIGKAKLINEIISNLSSEEVRANKEEFMAFSEELNLILEDIDEILIKKYIKPLDTLFNAMNAIIETINNKLGEYPVKSIVLKPLKEEIKKDDDFMSLEYVKKALSAS